MAIYLLIDTNILRRLISKSEINSDLKHLYDLVKEKHIHLLAPGVVLNEWQNHPEEEKVRFSKQSNFMRQN